MSYNLTGLDTGNNLFDYLQVLNNASSGIIIHLILLSIFLIIVIGTKSKVETKISFVAASGITSFLSIMFWWLGLFSFGYIFIPISILFGSLVYLGLSERVYS
jgi:hypothetical protein|tara:strand:- start:320 stop:628 length:309 start_codon:yes stop_codon:yes gene_type:complete